MPGKCALVVDDSPDSAMLLARVLKLCGFSVDTAADGVTALEKASKSSFDLIFLDIGLPEMDGFDLARLLRARPATRDARLVAVTGFTSSEDQERARAAGFDQFVSKPIDIAYIRSLVREMTGLSAP